MISRRHPSGVAKETCVLTSFDLAPRSSRARARRLTAAAVAVMVPFALLPAIVLAQATPAVRAGGNAELGDFLVGDNGFTLYIFTKDAAGVSNCSGMCEQLWPPLTVGAGVTPTAGDGVPGELGVAERADGTRQITYNDRPLYFFSNDSAPGETSGQEFVGRWFVAAVAGEQQTTTSPTPPPSGNAGLTSVGDGAAALPALLLAAAGLLAAGARALTGRGRAS